MPAGFPGRDVPAGRSVARVAPVNYEEFDDWYAAYETCLARNRCVVAKVGTEIAQIWPNGEYELLDSEQRSPLLEISAGD